MSWLNDVKWDDQGLVTVVAQDAGTKRVLMVAWMNREALEQTALTGEAVYFSRSRKRLWHKGEESGHVQKIREIRLDCDSDTVLLMVEQTQGIACHTGRESCLYYRLEENPAGEKSAKAKAAWSWVAVDPVLKDPAEIYTSGLSKK